MSMNSPRLIRAGIRLPRALLSPGSISQQKGVRAMSYPTGGYRAVLDPAGGINPAVLETQYAVRGQIAQRATELQDQLQQNSDPADNAQLPFDQVISCNIGNPQALGQKPLSFVREVLAATLCPTILDNENIRAQFNPDVIARAQSVLSSTRSLGAYSHSKGILAIRQRVAKAIERRDGFPCDPECLFLTDGASAGVKLLLSMLIRSEKDAVMIPVPQYPLYSAAMTLFGGKRVDYYLDETNDWELSVEELEVRLREAREKGFEVRALAVINPGNPTGQVLSQGNLQQIVRFCERENLLILADEVYQKNVYTPEKIFTSFKQVVCDLNSKVELVSFHSVSKGLFGECGLRGGYMEIHNIPQEARDEMYKMQSISLCASVPGQVVVDVMMTPPEPGNESYETYVREMGNIYESLKRRALTLSKAFNSDQFPGMQCNPAEGAMYLFPKITMPPGAVREAQNQNLAAPDVLYCMELLEETGIVVVPGSGFGQRPGTFHFRTTFLPPEDEIEQVAERMKTFHNKFMERYAS